MVDMQRYRSGHNGADSKFLEAPAVSSAENVRRTGLCAGSDFTISYRSCVFFLHSSGARITLEIYGELSERSKVRHSKCRVPKRNLGFESLTLRQKPSHIKAFAHMTGLFFSLKVTSAYMIFGKSSGVPAGLPCVRQGQDTHTHKKYPWLRRGYFFACQCWSLRQMVLRPMPRRLAAADWFIPSSASI